MSEIATPKPGSATATPGVGTGTALGSAAGALRARRPAREAYAFVCMHCGRGWEHSYEIRHYAGRDGREHVSYLTESGEVVPSPLLHPRCPSCTSTVVRIMSSGKVSAVQHWASSHHIPRRGDLTANDVEWPRRRRDPHRPSWLRRVLDHLRPSHRPAH
ncbi:hypothetical protein [Allostreptomyces psammosilenae]|uniref:Uncharacterized protein n=1 Tax=Allostreptomyces psammosilenae TaxID=1892865 RepID=A0A852ZZW4_9ACTN|nr:hypothetical protein [Allostreptomyces psammosilenae]NYI07876.1 hypothetical protein [Allostreptomyces psammosilenae]